MLERPSITPTCDVTRLLIRSLSVDIFGINVWMFEGELQCFQKFKTLSQSWSIGQPPKNQNGG